MCVPMRVCLCATLPAEECSWAPQNRVPSLSSRRDRLSVRTPSFVEEAGRGGAGIAVQPLLCPWVPPVMGAMLTVPRPSRAGWGDCPRRGLLGFREHREDGEAWLGLHW